jgi:hypothetical protein
MGRIERAFLNVFTSSVTERKHLHPAERMLTKFQQKLQAYECAEQKDPP